MGISTFDTIVINNASNQRVRQFGQNEVLKDRSAVGYHNIFSRTIHKAEGSYCHVESVGIDIRGILTGRVGIDGTVVGSISASQHDFGARDRCGRI